MGLAAPTPGADDQMERKGGDMPRTTLGKWAGWLFAASVILFAMLIVAYNTEVLGQVFAQGTAGGLALWVITALCLLGTVVTGVISWARLKDHSIVVVTATVFAALVTILLAMGSIPEN